MMREEHPSLGRDPMQTGHSEQSDTVVSLLFAEHPLNMLWS